MKNAIESRKEGFVSTKWGKIWYQWNGSRDKDPLLVIHGGPGFPHDYLEPLQELSSSQPVVFYDQLGCGNSDRPKKTNLWTVQRYLEELAVVIKSLKIHKVHLLGHSWGAILATEYALIHPDIVSSLALASPLLSTERWLRDTDKFIKELPMDLQNVINQAKATGNFNSQDFQQATQILYQYHVCRLNPLPQCYLEAAAKMGSSVYETMWGPTEFICTGNLYNYDCSKRLNKLLVPTLLTCGRYDGATPQTVEYYKNQIPNSEITVFERSSHMPHLEEKNDYLTEIQRFIRQ